LAETESPVDISLDHPTRTVDVGALESLLLKAAEAEGATIAYLGVILTDHETVLDLNREYLEHDYLTDVLSFSLNEGTTSEIDGEVYVDLDTAAERCTEFGASFELETARYCLHGMLHLLGYDDATDEQRAAMRLREDQLLTLL
jgi:probable rRNA maturation factor